MSPKLTIAIVKWMFLLIGFSLLTCGGIAFINTSQIVAHSLIGEGKIIKLKHQKDGVSYPVVTFQTKEGEDVTFTSKTVNDVSAFSIGDQVKVYYNSSQPIKAEIISFSTQWFLSILLLAMGSIFTFVPAIMIFFSWRKKKLQQWLDWNGEKVSAQVTEVCMNSSISVNEMSPYVIYAQWFNPRTNQLYLFCSDNIWFDPSQFVGKNIQVLVDLNNPKKYRVDVSFLPKIA